MSSRTGAKPPAAPARPLAPERLRPLARTPFYAARGARARILARVPLKPPPGAPPPVFIIGCGRSGTTLLGRLFAAHPAVSYVYEPYHRWAALEPATDFLQLYSRGEHHCLLGSSSATATARRRFARLMKAPPGSTFVEKSPVNALRIGYLDALAPSARFVHITRDGVDVARSIERIAAVTRRMAFRPPLNEWWGVGDAKWAALERDGRAAGYYPGELAQLTRDAQRGAYEWVLSLREVERWRSHLGPRLVELRYPDLTEEPRAVLTAVMPAVGLAAPDSWLDQAAAMVGPARSAPGASLALPGQLGADFNRLQASLGFPGRATVSGS